MLKLHEAQSLHILSEIRHKCTHTKGNVSSSRLVKQLKSYYEESVRCTQHRFKCKKLLE